jgi:hypothetical protein
LFYRYEQLMAICLELAGRFQSGELSFPPKSTLRYSRSQRLCVEGFMNRKEQSRRELNNGPGVSFHDEAKITSNSYLSFSLRGDFIYRSLHVYRLQECNADRCRGTTFLSTNF